MRQLHTLIIESSEAEADRMVLELSQNGFDLIHERVRSISEAEMALRNAHWDVVIADDDVTGCSADAVASLLRERNVEVPFICVSGKTGESVAVNAIKAGASDYIVKNNLSRLVPVIEHELAAFQQRRQSIRAHAAKHHLAAIVESSNDAIYSRTPEGLVVSWNKAAERMFGFTASEMIGRSNCLLVPPERLHELDESFERVGRGESVGRSETVRLRKDGSRFDVSITVSPIRNDDGTVIGASVIARDISERRREEREKLRLIEELTHALSHVKELKGLLPICASCKKIRDDKGYWQQVETYIKQHSDAEFTHGICPECAKRLYPGIDVKV